MKKNLKMQWLLLLHRKEFYICFTIMVIMAICSFIAGCKYYFNYDYSMLHAADMMFFLRAYQFTYNGIMITLYPLLVVIPFADSYLIDEHFNILSIIKTRTQIKHYYFSKIIIVFISTTIVLLIPQLINVFLNTITFPSHVIGDFTNVPYELSYTGVLENINYPRLFVLHPNLYNLLYIFIFTFVGSLIATAIYCISFYIRKSRLFIICLYFLVNNIIILINLWGKPPVNININAYIFGCNDTDNKSNIIFWGYIIFFIALIAILSKITLKRFRKQII